MYIVSLINWRTYISKDRSKGLKSPHLKTPHFPCLDILTVIISLFSNIITIIVKRVALDSDISDIANVDKNIFYRILQIFVNRTASFREIWGHAVTRNTSQTGEAEAWSHTGTYWVVIEHTKYKHEPDRKLYEESQNWGQPRAIAIQTISTRKV